VISGYAADYFPEGQKEAASMRIIGTLLDKAAKKPKWVTEIVDVGDLNSLS
jgi:hypothetical protein